MQCIRERLTMLYLGRDAASASSRTKLRRFYGSADIKTEQSACEKLTILFKMFADCSMQFWKIFQGYISLDILNTVLHVHVERCMNSATTFRVCIFSVRRLKAM